MSDQILPFEFEGSGVRVISIDGAPWFIAADVASVLGYRMASDMTRRLDPDEKGTRSVRTPSGDQNMTVIAEAGLYSSILGSRVEGAKQFKRWVTHEVIPAIRKAGSYSAPKTLEQRSLELMGELVAEVARHTATIADLEPRAGAWDEIASGSGDHAVADAAKMLQRAGIETGRDRLFDSMHAIGWVYRAQGRWQAMQSAVDTGYLRHKPQSHNHPDTGQRVIDPPQVRVTMKGIERLRVRLQSPVAELVAT